MQDAGGTQSAKLIRQEPHSQNVSNKVPCYITLGCKCLPGRNTLASRAHSQVINKMKCCEYHPRVPRRESNYFKKPQLLESWKNLKLFCVTVSRIHKFCFALGFRSALCSVLQCIFAVCLAVHFAVCFTVQFECILQYVL